MGRRFLVEHRRSSNSILSFLFFLNSFFRYFFPRIFHLFVPSRKKDTMAVENKSEEDAIDHTKMLKEELCGNSPNKR